MITFHIYSFLAGVLFPISFLILDYLYNLPPTKGDEDYEEYQEFLEWKRRKDKRNESNRHRER